MVVALAPPVDGNRNRQSIFRDRQIFFAEA
jgi:hypothetical protein